MDALRGVATLAAVVAAVAVRVMVGTLVGMRVGLSSIGAPRGSPDLINVFFFPQQVWIQTTENIFTVL